MSDVFTKAKRSEVMSHIRGRGNRKTEIAMVDFFRRHRISGWRRNQQVFGKPDFVFRKNRVAVFVDGCFWHSCPLHGTMPASNREFWEKKIASNVARDLAVTKALRRDGWKVVRIWEHELVEMNEHRLVMKIRFLIGRQPLSHSPF